MKEQNSEFPTLQKTSDSDKKPKSEFPTLAFVNMLQAYVRQWSVPVPKTAVSANLMSLIKVPVNVSTQNQIFLKSKNFPRLFATSSPTKV